MEAQTVYIKVWRLSLKSATNMSKRRIQELNAGIGELRQLLSCVVCCELLKDPYQPARQRCGHHVCRLCLRGRKRLSPVCTQCSDCADFKTYKENKSMAWQVLCYKTLCRHLQNSLLYAQLSGHRPSHERSLHDRSVPRIELPDESAQWFIQEGANYIDMCDTFLPQPDQLSLKDISSLPAETPPTTAATTPELPYEQHMPEQLSITDIELEAAATGDQVHFAHPLPLMPSSARMLSHSHIAPQAQHMVMPAAQPIMTAGYLEPSWTDQVDLSAAFSMPSTANYTIEMPRSDVHIPSIGQVVIIPPELTHTSFESVSSSTSTAANIKRRHAQVITDNVVEDVSATKRLRPEASTIKAASQAKHYNAATPRAATIPRSTATETQKATTSTTLKPQTVPAVTSKVTTSHKPVATPAIVPVAINTTSSTTKATKSPVRSAVLKSKEKKRCCRCGTSSAPGLMTCRNSRCVCYSSGYKCGDCKCNGCKNPHTYSGGETSDEDDKETEKGNTGQIIHTPTSTMQADYTLVPLENLQQSQHPLVLIQNESGKLQGFNIFKGSEPIDPAEAGFQRVPLRSNDGNSTIPEFAYVRPTASVQTATSILPPDTAQSHHSPLAPPPLKKFKGSKVETTLSTDELLGGGSSQSKASTGDGLVSEKAHSLFEDIMSGSDDL